MASNDSDSDTDFDYITASNSSISDDTIATLSASHKTFHYNFNIIVRVIKKSKVRYLRRGRYGKNPQKYFTARLKDKSGEIDAVFYNEHFSNYNTIIWQGLKYNIKNGRIKTFKIQGNQLIVTEKTKIERLTPRFDEQYSLRI